MHQEFVTNTWFKERKTKQYTWKSPGDRKRYQIDYILVKQRYRNGIKDVKTPLQIISYAHKAIESVIFLEEIASFMMPCVGYDHW